MLTHYYNNREKNKKQILDILNVYIHPKEISQLIYDYVGTLFELHHKETHTYQSLFGLQDTENKISHFENLDHDISSAKDYSDNYIINYGLNEAYELFLDSKQKFIEESMLHDLYTNTIKEVIDLIELSVDTVIDNTSPDLKSNYSNSIKI